MISELLGYLGGGSLIIIALSGWLSKVWSSRILANEQAVLNQEIESLKSRLSTAENINSALGINAVNKRIEVVEAVYVEWAMVVKCIQEIRNSYHDNNFDNIIEAVSKLKDHHEKLDERMIIGKLYLTEKLSFKIYGLSLGFHECVKSSLNLNNSDILIKSEAYTRFYKDIELYEGVMKMFEREFRELLGTNFISNQQHT